MISINLTPCDLDPWLKHARTPGTVFRLGPGDFTTGGAFGFAEHDLCMLAPGCRLIGAGSLLTRIRLCQPVTEHGGIPTNYIESLTGGARTIGTSEHLEMSGFTLDLYGVEMTMPRIGIHLWTSKATIRDVRVMGVRGMREWHGEVDEGFGILINNAYSSDCDGGHRIKDCHIALTEPKHENYTTAMFVGCPKRAVEMLRSIVSDVRCVASGAHAAFAANANTTFTNCEAHGFIRAFFCDTAAIQNVVIRNMLASGLSWGVHIEGGSAIAGFAVHDSLFCFAARPNDWAQAVRIESIASHGVRFNNCEFFAGEEAKKTGLASMGRTAGANTGAVEMHNCRWHGPWKPAVIQNGAGKW